MVGPIPCRRSKFLSDACRGSRGLLVSPLHSPSKKRLVGSMCVILSHSTISKTWPAPDGTRSRGPELTTSKLSILSSESLLHCEDMRMAVCTRETNNGILLIFLFLMTNTISGEDHYYFDILLALVSLDDSSEHTQLNFFSPSPVAQMLSRPAITSNMCRKAESKKHFH